MSGTSRALLRIGARTARRNRLRSILIVALIALPVAASIVAAATARATTPSPQEQRAWYVGGAQWSLEPSTLPFAGIETVPFGADTQPGDERSAALSTWAASTTPTRAAGLFAEALGADVSVTWSSWLTSGDHPVELRSFDPTDPLTDGILVLDRGRFATAPDEATVSRPLTNRLKLAIGDTLAIPGGEPVKIVGIMQVGADAHSLMIQVDRPSPPAQATVRFLIGAVNPGVSVPRRLAIAVDAAAGHPGAFDAGMYEMGSFNLSATDQLFSFDDSTPLQLDRPPVLSGFVSALLLLEVALIAAAAFTTGARRRLSEIGLLATIGADAGHIRRLILAEALVLGVAGSLAGITIGVIGTHLLGSVISGLAAHAVVHVSNRPGELALPALFGMIAAVGAAWFPARSLARVPPTAALAGRIPSRPLRARVIPVGVALLTVGMVIVAVAARGARSHVNGISDAALAAIMVGSMLCLGGAALLGTWVVARLGRASESLPLLVRLVTRDAARQQFRSAVTIAGLVVVTAAPIMVAAVATTANAARDTSYLPAPDEIVVDSFGEPGDPGAASRAAAEKALVRATIPIKAEADLQLLGWRDRGPDQVTTDLWAYDGTGYSTRVALGTPQAARALRLPTSVGETLARGEIVAIAMHEPSMTFTDPSAPIGTEATVRLDARVYDGRALSWATPGFLVPPSIADRFGLEVLRTETVMIADGPLSDAQILALDRRHQVVDGPDTLALRAADVAPSSSEVGVVYASRVASPVPVELLAVAATALIVLVIGGCLVSIAATESDRDIATMIRVGAAPSLRRRVLAAQSWYHAVLSALLAVPAGLLLFAALRLALVAPPPMVFPWRSITAVIVVVPAFLASVVYAVVRSRPAMATRS